MIQGPFFSKDSQCDLWLWFLKKTHTFDRSWNRVSFNWIWTHPVALSDLSINSSSRPKKETPRGNLCKISASYGLENQQYLSYWAMFLWQHNSALADIGKGVKYSLTAGGLSGISITVESLQTDWSPKTQDTGETRAGMRAHFLNGLRVCTGIVPKIATFIQFMCEKGKKKDKTVGLRRKTVEKAIWVYIQLWVQNVIDGNLPKIPLLILKALFWDHKGLKWLNSSRSPK